MFISPDQAVASSEVAFDNGRVKARRAAEYLRASADRVSLDTFRSVPGNDDAARLVLAVNGVGEALLALNWTLAALVPEPPRRRWWRRTVR